MSDRRQVISKKLSDGTPGIPKEQRVTNDVSDKVFTCRVVTCHSSLLFLAEMTGFEPVKGF
ncbi:MAG: hypothetical protein ND866_01695 [Pyrinomonadaceae bacterium]|nr:hypothetical protein [Pyrinomonadaceae bacterium]